MRPHLFGKPAEFFGILRGHHYRGDEIDLIS